MAFANQRLVIRAAAALTDERKLVVAAEVARIGSGFEAPEYWVAGVGRQRQVLVKELADGLSTAGVILPPERSRAAARSSSTFSWGISRPRRQATAQTSGSNSSRGLSRGFDLGSISRPQCGSMPVKQAAPWHRPGTADRHCALGIIECRVAYRTKKNSRSRTGQSWSRAMPRTPAPRREIRFLRQCSEMRQQQQHLLPASRHKIKPVVLIAAVSAWENDRLCGKR